jgi:uncharacterized membrane protein YphA (DoxX/SURF4 family)
MKIIDILRFFSRLIFGSLFIFSGFVKAVDPLGSTYKFKDYFEAFQWEGLMGLAFPLAILLSMTELTIGFAILTDLRRKIFSWIGLVFMVFFTGLTLYIAIKDPVSDCGCFGDALILTNWQTFYKNIALLIPIIFLFVTRKSTENRWLGLVEWSFIGTFAVLSVLLSVYSYRNLPPLDFRPYAIGSNIPEKMSIPEGAPQDKYETILVYEKDGVQKEFASEDIPWQDTTWKWVETKSILIEKGYQSPIHDFSVTSREGNEITDLILEDEGYSFLLISYDIPAVKKAVWDSVNKFAVWANIQDYNYYGITSSTENEINNLLDVRPLAFEFYTADEITLKTIVRSNPGLLLIKNGTIIGKWHYSNIPSQQELKNKNLVSYCLNDQAKRKERNYVLALMFALTTSIFLVGYLFRDWK